MLCVGKVYVVSMYLIDNVNVRVYWIQTATKQSSLLNSYAFHNYWPLKLIWRLGTVSFSIYKCKQASN